MVEALKESGGGLCLLDGKLIEKLHVDRAREILAQQELIEST